MQSHIQAEARTETPENRPLVLVVCAGNVCRSPVAAALLADRLRREGYGFIRVESAGTRVVKPAPPVLYALHALAERGIDIRDHRARPATPELLRQAALILVMERAQADDVRALVPEAAPRVHRFSEIGGEAYDILAPYQGSLWAHRLLVEELAGLVDAGWRQVVVWATGNLPASP